MKTRFLFLFVFPSDKFEQWQALATPQLNSSLKSAEARVHKKVKQTMIQADETVAADPSLPDKQMQATRGQNSI